MYTVSSRKKIAETSMKLSSRWAERSKSTFTGANGSMLFGIQQGGMFKDLREQALTISITLGLMAMLWGSGGWRASRKDV